MKSEQDQHTLTAIQTDMLRELHRKQDILIEVLDGEIAVASFHASKYKEEECYDRLVSLKKARNTLDVFLKVTQARPEAE